MASAVPPTRAPGQGYSPSTFNSNPQKPHDSLADNMQNLQINRPPGQPSTMVPGARPPPFANSSIQSPAPLVPPPGSLPGASQPRPTLPPAGFPRASPPSRPPPPSFQGNSQSSPVPGRPTGQPFPQPPPPSSASRPFAGTFSPASPATGPVMSHMNVSAAGSSNGPNLFNQRPVNVAPRLPPPGAAQGPPIGPPLGGTPLRGPPVMDSSPRALQAQCVSSFVGSAAPGISRGIPSQIPMSFPSGGQGLRAPSALGLASQPPSQANIPGTPMEPGSMQFPTMYGIPQFPANQQAPHTSPGMSLSSTAGALGSDPSRIDPNHVPHPEPSSAFTLFETRQNNQACIPPPATSDFVVKDTGNCSPRYMRCTIGQIPCSSDLATTSSMPLALLVQPLALPHPSEEPVQVVDFGVSGPLRCSRCKGYINPFMKFVNHGKCFICNLCGVTNDTPQEYYCNLGPDGRRRDTDERPELCRGTVEFVASKEYMVRDPMPAIFFFVIDVSMNAVQTGATAAACSAISQVISDLPEGRRTMVGIATFDSTIHFYSLKRAQQQPLMLIVPDVQDVYTPLQSDIVVQLSECREHFEQLLESIPSMFQTNRVAESAFGAAIKAAYLAMNSTGGRLLLFQSVLPSFGMGELSSREAEGRVNTSCSEKEVHKLLQPLDKTLKTMAIELAEYQVCVDVFITSQSYVDIASVSGVPKTTGGQVYYYYPFSAVTDSVKLYNDLRWNITRPQGFEAVMRVRCSQGLQVQEYSGNFCKRTPTDVDLPAIDCDKTIMVTFKHDDKFQDNTECSFQCALLYTTVYGQRRIRVHTLSLPCTTNLSNLFRAADLDAQFTFFLKQAANDIPNSPLIQVRQQMSNLCINILHAFRKYCARASSSGQLILPEALRLLPLYTLALIKSTGLRADERVDDRSCWASRASFLSTSLAVPLVYPRMIAVHNLLSQEEDTPAIPYSVPLSSEHVSDDGIYLLENGEDCLIYVGTMVNTEVLLQLFGVPSVDGIPAQFVLKQFDNDLSKKLNDVANEIRQKRCSYLRMQLCKKGDPSGMLFFSYMVEDKAPGNQSYVEFLAHIHRQIQTKRD